MKNNRLNDFVTFVTKQNKRSMTVASIDDLKSLIFKLLKRNNIKFLSIENLEDSDKTELGSTITFHVTLAKNKHITNSTLKQFTKQLQVSLFDNYRFSDILIGANQNALSFNIVFNKIKE